MARILDKTQYNRLSQAGKLGNFFQKYDTITELTHSDYCGYITVRSRQASDKELFVPFIHSFELANKRTDARVYYQQCPAPETGRIINFQVMPGRSERLGDRTDAQCELEYALDDATNLRHSLERSGKTVKGLNAWLTLSKYLQEDMEVLRDIWREYPTAIIEGTKFTRNVGEFNQKLIIWEVRSSY